MKKNIYTLYTMNTIKHLELMLFFILGVCIANAQDLVPSPEIDASNYPGIQQAINDAPSGATVILPAGEYYTHLEINKSLTLQGQGQESTVLYYMDESMRQTAHQDIMDYADSAVPIIRIDKNVEVVIRDLELRGAKEGFSHFGYSSFGIVSKSADLTMQNVTMRRFKNIFVWADKGNLIAENVVFAENQGFVMQGDLGFHLTNMSNVRITGFQQLSDEIDHSININDIPHNDEIERITTVRIEDSFITASSLYWGDCLRTYGATDITVRNTVFKRNMDAEPPRDIANSGISLNGRRTSLTVDSSVFENLPDAMVFYTNKYGDQYYEVSVQNSRFLNSSRSFFYFSGEGALELDLGGGSLNSEGSNVFDDQSLMMRVQYNPDVMVYASADIAEYFEPYLVASGNDGGVSTETTVQPSFSFDSQSMSVTDKDGNTHSYFFTDLMLIRAIEFDTFILAVYKNNRGAYYLGQFSDKLEYVTEYFFGTSEIIQVKGTSSLLVVRYLNNGYEYVGTFNKDLEFLGSYWFYKNTDIVDIGVRNGNPFVTYDYGVDADRKRYTSLFDRSMAFIRTYAGE